MNQNNDRIWNKTVNKKKGYKKKLEVTLKLKISSINVYHQHFLNKESTINLN